MTLRGRIYVVVLNWNGWSNTIECVESLLRSSFAEQQIIIVDNDSTDGSVAHLLSFFDERGKFGGLRQGEISLPGVMHRGTAIPYTLLTEADTVSRNKPVTGSAGDAADRAGSPVILIRNDHNYGFAKGINTALRYCLLQDDCRYIWILNNDAIVDKDALSALVKEAEGNAAVGIVGSVIRYYARPSFIQAIGGGKFIGWLGMSKLYGRDMPVSSLPSFTKERVLKKINYIMGASLLVRREVVREIGLFDERYFLYAEEVDLARRAQRAGWLISVALDSYIYHKDSASVTANGSSLYFYHKNRSETLFQLETYGRWFVFAVLPLRLSYVIFKTFNVQALIHSVRGVRDAFGAMKRA